MSFHSSHSFEETIYRMLPDFTQQQSLGELREAERLSLNATLPPAEVPGVRIEKLLGQGAFGQVWKGRDLNTGREVAIKFYLHRGGVNWSLLGREVKHLVNMSTGRYIVQVLTVGWEAEPPYYVMEYLENGSLEDLIRQRSKLSVAEAVTMFRQIAEGLNFAHGKGVLHCDLKPANVLLDHDWRPRLADFGQSRMSHEQSPSLGTLFYMAPEQADLAASADASWDVYAIGAILYTMLVGSPPYRSPDVVEKLDTAASLPERLERYRQAIYQSPTPRAHYRQHGADKALCQIVDQCLAKQPEDRFANVQQVLAAVSRRDAARVRLPLYLLGIVGPLLLLLLMMLFSLRGISVAKQESLERAQQLALQSNQFAAKFAARTLESEIAALFRMVEDEAQREPLQKILDETLQANHAMLQELADGREHPETSQRLSVAPQLNTLEQYLSTRLMEIARQDSKDGQSTIFSSMFVLDALATNLAIAYSDPEEQTAQKPVARNFAYRSYFTGLREDLPQDVSPRPQVTRFTHFSGTFRSTSTNKWKVAVSAPIWPSNTDSEEFSVATVPIGVVVLTINLGDFELLSDRESESGDYRLAVLVDGRVGSQQGTLLQHPLLRELDATYKPNQTPDAVPQINKDQLSELLARGLTNYRDPASKHRRGEAYSGDWIAAIQQVHLPVHPSKATNDRSLADLWVLVQERASRVREPVQKLGNRLQNEGLVGLAAVVLVVFVLWYFVFRMSAAQERLPSVVHTSNAVHYPSLKPTSTGN